MQNLHRALLTNWKIRYSNLYNQLFLIFEVPMRHLILACSLALASLWAHAEIIDIDKAELDKLIKSGVPVVDIRTQAEWEDTGIVNGSKLLTFYDERGRVDPAAWLEKLAPIAKPDQPVIVICRSGNRTKDVSQLLSQQAGYTKVYNVKSGIKGWIKEGGAVVPATQSIAACRTAKTC
jgi:rhodanese-related sulfurtransferase